MGRSSQRRSLRPVAATIASTLATKVAENGDKLSPETATNLMLPETATFVAVFGNFYRQCGVWTGFKSTRHNYRRWQKFMSVPINIAAVGY